MKKKLFLAFTLLIIRIQAAEIYQEQALEDFRQVHSIAALQDDQTRNMIVDWAYQIPFEDTEQLVKWWTPKVDEDLGVVQEILKEIKDYLRPRTRSLEEQIGIIFTAAQLAYHRKEMAQSLTILSENLSHVFSQSKPTVEEILGEDFIYRVITRPFQFLDSGLVDLTLSFMSFPQLSSVATASPECLEKVLKQRADFVAKTGNTLILNSSINDYYIIGLLKILENAKKLSPIKLLTINDYIPPLGLRKTIQYFPEIQEIDFRISYALGTFKIAKDEIEALSELMNLHSLRFLYSHTLTPVNFTGLPYLLDSIEAEKFRPLRKLAFSGFAFENSDLKRLTTVLRSCPYLTDLSIMNSSLHKKNFSIFAKTLSCLPQLTSLSFYYNRLMNDENLAELAQEIIDGALPQLRFLSLGRCDTIAQKGVGILTNALSKHPTFESLTLPSGEIIAVEAL